MKLATLFSKPRRADAPSFVLHAFTRPDGSFDYERYRARQEAGNKSKLGNCWVLPENIAFLADRLKERLPEIRFGLATGRGAGWSSYGCASIWAASSSARRSRKPPHSFPTPSSGISMR